MDSLREEIRESQKARTDLMKWKMVLVASVGAAGLGFTSKSGNGTNNGDHLVRHRGIRHLRQWFSSYLPHRCLQALA